MTYTFGDTCWVKLCAKWPELQNIAHTEARTLIDRALVEFKAPRSGARMNDIPPMPDDVAAYFKEIGYGIDPMEFIDFYQQKGWKLGRNGTMMKDWRAAARNWKRSGWGHLLDGKKTSAQNGTASLGALQIQLDLVKEQIREIIYPGGCAHSVQPKGEKRVQYDKLVAQRESLRNRIDQFSQ